MIEPEKCNSFADLMIPDEMHKFEKRNIATYTCVKFNVFKYV